jgi:hypothetical protein
MNEGKKFVPSEHLSDSINLNIMQSERDGGLYLRDVKDGETFLVKTQNSTYTIKRVSENKYLISGNWNYCPTPTEASISGSTWGGSMLKIGYVGVGMHLEFYTDRGRITTSAIQMVQPPVLDVK